MTDDEPINELTIVGDKAHFKSVAYSPYFALRPPEVMAQAEDQFAYALSARGLRVSGQTTFTQLDNPSDVTEHAFEPGWITGPWWHRYSISASVEPVA